MWCRRGHAPGLFLETDRCDGICLGCLAELLVNPSSFVTHKAYALAELSRCLDDNEFCESFLRYHSHFLVGPLCQSVFSCQDDALAKAMVEFALNLCRSTIGDNRSLLDDFITFTSMQLGSRATIIWNKGQRFTLHAMGQLLDLHAKVDDSVPRTIQFQDLMENLLSALQHCGDEIKGEVLFLLYRISSFSGGIEKISKWFYKIIPLVVTILLKAESDELRTNCIAVLSVLARGGIFQLRSQEIRVNEDPVSNGEKLDFVATFAEAIKGSLLSSDVQVQLSSLQLLCYICPSNVDITKELGVLVEEGIADYIFEVLRVSESLPTLAVTAVRTLTKLSAAKGVFSQRLMLGLEAIVRVLEQSMGSGFCSIQEDALQLLAVGLTEWPGIVNSSKAEQVFDTLANLVHQHANRVRDTGTVGEALNSSSGTYTATCLAMIALLHLPWFSSISAISPRLVKVQADVVTIIIHDRAIQPKALRHSLNILQQALLLEGNAGERICDCLSADEHFFHFLAKLIQNLEDEGAAEAVISFLSTAVRTEAHARMLAEDKWLSRAFAMTGRFRSQSFKGNILTFVAGMLCAFNDEVDEGVLAAVHNLSTDPSDLLVLLEQYGPFVADLHSAVVLIIYTSYVHHDRLVDPEKLLPSLEQFILLHVSSCRAHTKCLFQVVTLYAILRLDLPLETSFSAEAERLLVATIQRNEELGGLTVKSPRFVIDWMLSQEGLKPLCVQHVRSLFHAAKLGAKGELEAICNVIEHENGATSINSLLRNAALDNVEDEMEILLTVLKLVVEFKDDLANHFQQKEIISNLRNWYVLWGTTAAASTLICFLELLVQLLHGLTSETAARTVPWHDIAHQTMYLFIRREENFQQSLASSALSFLCLLCYRSSELLFLSEAAAGAYKTNEFCLALKRRVTDFRREDERILSLSLLFHLLWLQQPRHEELDEKAAIAYEVLCRIIYSVSGWPRIIALCCMSEKLLHLSVANLQLSATFEPSSLKSMVVLLQEFALHENELIQTNASASLLSLLTSKHLIPKQKQAVEQSSWFCFLAREYTRSISACTNNAFEPKFKLLVSLLKLSKEHNWFSSAFDSPSIASVVSTLAARTVSFWEVCFFLELLRMKCLGTEDVQALSEHYQSYRRSCHQKFATEQTISVTKRSQESVNSSPDSSVMVIERVLSQRTAGHEGLDAVLGKIDEFMRESRLELEMKNNDRRIISA